MFAKFLRRNRHQTVSTIETEQQKLDNLRYNHAANPLMQLHLDRMQTALEATMRAI